MKTNNAFNTPLSPAGVLIALVVIVLSFAGTLSAKRGEASTVGTVPPVDSYGLRKAEYLSRQRALRRVEQARAEAGLRMYCRSVTKAECRDMEIALGR